MGFLARFLFLLLLFTRIRALLDPLGRAIQLKKSELLTGGVYTNMINLGPLNIFIKQP